MIVEVCVLMCDTERSTVTTKNGPDAVRQHHVRRDLTPTKEGLVTHDKPLPSGSEEGRLGWRASDLHPDTIEPFRERFAKRTEVAGPDECWLWIGQRMPSGYGTFHLRWGRYNTGRRVLAHRAAWVLANGAPLLDQLTIDHLCNVRACVNPAHLEVVSLGENSRRAAVRRTGIEDDVERRAAAAARKRERYWRLKAQAAEQKAQ